MKHTLTSLVALLTLIALLVPKTPEQAPVEVDLQSPLSECTKTLGSMMPSTPPPTSLSIHGLSPGMTLAELPNKPEDLEISVDKQNRVWRVEGNQLEIDSTTLTRDNTWEELLALLGQPDPQDLPHDACVWTHFHFQYAELNLSGGLIPQTQTAWFTLCDHSGVSVESCCPIASPGY